MRTLTAVVLVVVFAAALAAGRALGEPLQSTTVAPGADFLALDRNRDGAISRVEVLADRDVAKRFAEFDADKDGRLSEDEFVLAKEDVHKRALRDAAITARVKAALFAQKGIPSTAIGVETYEGKVLLSGRVGSPEIVSKAGRVTKTVDGVLTVDNNIAVR
jgi:hyperosmotically inducible protein